MPHTILIQLNNFICALGLLLVDLIAWVISYALAGQSELQGQDLFVLTGMWLAWHLLVRRKYMARYPFWSELLSLIKGVTAFMLVGMLSSLLGRQSLDVWVHLQWGLILLIVLVIARSSARAVLRKLGLWSLPTLILVRMKTYSKPLSPFKVKSPWATPLMVLWSRQGKANSCRRAIGQLSGPSMLKTLTP